MSQRSRFVSLSSKIFAAAITVAALFFAISAGSQTAGTLAGNHPSSIPAGWTAAPDDRQINLVAVLALRNTAALEQLESDLQDRHSPRYHTWLTTDQFVAQFGPTSDQMSAVVGWLTQHDFNIIASNQRTRRISFSGTVATIRQALQTSIISDGTSYVNTSDPVVPAELASTIQAVLGLSSLSQPSRSDSRTSTARKSPGVTLAELFSDEIVTYKGQTTGPNFGPADLFTFYNETPVLNGGNNGTGAPDCVALPEVGDVTPAALKQFDSQFNLPPVVLKKILVNGSSPGLPSDYEPALDVEWVHAVSPNTPIYFYLANSNKTTTPYLDAVTQAIDDNRCGVISSSVEDICPDVATIQVYNTELEQGVVQGQTIFKSSGDYGDNWYCGNTIPAIIAPTSAPTPAIYDQTGCKFVPPKWHRLTAERG